MEFETSLTGARDLRDQWLSTTTAAISGSSAADIGGGAKPSKKELEQSTKALKNKLLAVKWDFEDLEELLGVYKFDNTQAANLLAVDSDEVNVVEEIRRNIGDWRNDIAQMMGQLEKAESSNKLFNKHGITFHNPVSTLNSTSNKYERLTESQQQQQQHNQAEIEDVVQFDKSLVQSPRGASIVNNLLYDHLELDLQQQQMQLTNQHHQLIGSSSRNSLSDPSQVFNNLSRPVTTNVYMNPNENEMILDMLETEYYNPPDGLLHNNLTSTNNNNNNSNRIDTMFKKLFDTDRNKFLGTIVFLCSFPTLLILFMFA